MRAHLLSPDTPENVPALANSFNEKDLTDPGGADTPSPPFSPTLPQTPPTIAAETTITKPDVVVVVSSGSQSGALLLGGCQSSLSSDRRKDDAEASLNLKQKTDLGLGLLRLTAKTHDRKSIAFNEYESDADSFATAISYRLEAERQVEAGTEGGDRADTTHSGSEDTQLQDVEFSTGQSLSELDDGTETRGRGEPSTERRHIFGSDSTMMATEAEGKADVAPQYQLRNYALESKSDKADMAHDEVQRWKESKSTPKTMDPLSLLVSAPAPPLPPTPVMRAISCECGRVIKTPVNPTAAATAYFQDSRHQRQFACDQPATATTLDQSSPMPSPTTRSPPRLAPPYFVPLSSFIPSSYQASFSSWRDSFIAPSSASLLSSHIYIPNGDADDDGDNGVNDITHDRPAASTAAAQGISTAPKNMGSHRPSHGLNNIGHHGAAVAGRVAGLVMSTGQATFNYVTSTVAPSAIHIAHRSASSTIGFLASHIPGPSAVPSMLPWFLGEVLFNRQSTDGTNLSGVSEDVGGSSERGYRHPGIDLAPNRRSRNTMDGRGLGDRMTRSSPNLANPSRARSTRELSLPDMAHRRSRRLTDSSTSSSASRVPTTATALTSTNRSRRTRRTTLQVIPGPEGLDPETRRRLEAQGLAALGLRDESAGQGWRNWWDPRRYGLKKYILFHQIRKPRPCTTILFLILIVCIVPPVVFRR